MKSQPEIQDQKPRSRHAYTRQSRRAEKREIADALFALELDKNTDLAYDSDELDAITGFAPDWMAA